jgi:hypothetical protein
MFLQEARQGWAVAGSESQQQNTAADPNSDNAKGSGDFTQPKEDQGLIHGVGVLYGAPACFEISQEYVEQQALGVVYSVRASLFCAQTVTLKTCQYTHPSCHYATRSQ